MLTLNVGLRHPMVESVVAALCGTPDSYRTRTTNTSIGYVSPEATWREWLVTPESAEEVATEIARRVDTFAMPYLTRLAQDTDALMTDVRRSTSTAPDKCRVAVLLTLQGRISDATASLARDVTDLAQLADQQSPFAESVRNMASQTTAWIESRA